jgi:hypothetical protein
VRLNITKHRTPPRRASTSANSREIFDEPINGTTTIWEDNQSTIVYSQNALGSEKTKHIDLKWPFLKDHVEHGTVRLVYLPTDRIVADMFTKPLP